MVRNYRLDNIKILMVFFVVFGHLIEPLILQNQIIKTIWVWIYTFHMPVFVMVAGMLSKAEYGHDFLLKQTKTIFVPFVIFTIGYEVFHLLLNGTISNYGINFQPYWILWFLFSLFVWRLTLPLVLKFRHPIVIAIFISLLAGYIDPIGRTMGISRTLYFFPFFIFGHIILPKFLVFIENITLPKYLFRCLLWCGLAISMVAVLNLQSFSHKWVLGSHAYIFVGSDVWYVGVYRLGLYGLSFFVSLIVIGLIPYRKLRLTSKGKNSLYIYLWHGFVVKALIAVGLMNVIGALPTYVSLLVLFLMSIGLTFILSLNFLGALTEQYLFNPIRNNLPKGIVRETL